MNDVAPRLHPEPQVLAAFVEGRLRGTERETVIDHVNQCDDCQSQIAAAAAFEQEESATPAKFPMWWLAAAAMGIVIVGGLLTLSGRSDRALRDLQVGGRKTSGRLTGIPYAALDKKRGPGETLSIHQQEVFADLNDAVTQHPGADILRERGVAYLLIGNGSLGQRDLAAASALKPNDAQILSDLAAAEIEVRQYRKAAEHSARAMALSSPPLPAAAFNHAVAVELLPDDGEHPADPGSAIDPRPAIEAWGRYLKLDPNGPWAAEANERLDAFKHR